MQNILTLSETGHEYEVQRGPWTSRLERALIMADVFGDMVVIEPTGGQNDKTIGRTMVRQVRQKGQIFDRATGYLGALKKRGTDWTGSASL